MVYAVSNNLGSIRRRSPIQGDSTRIGFSHQSRWRNEGDRRVVGHRLVGETGHLVGGRVLQLVAAARGRLGVADLHPRVVVRRRRGQGQRHRGAADGRRPAQALPSARCRCDGVFFTAKALLARLAAAASVSLKVMTSAVPSTVAELSVGAVVSGTVTVIGLDLSLSITQARGVISEHRITVGGTGSHVSVEVCGWRIA